ncbi:MAG: hypothetical protein KDD04_09425, partial [Sinomicrobium sp.]|nr:hypothetical protein [Sinomicrobium sp.]
PFCSHVTFAGMDALNLVQEKLQQADTPRNIENTCYYNMDLSAEELRALISPLMDELNKRSSSAAKKYSPGSANTGYQSTSGQYSYFTLIEYVQNNIAGLETYTQNNINTLKDIFNALQMDPGKVNITCRHNTLHRVTLPYKDYRLFYYALAQLTSDSSQKRRCTIEARPGRNRRPSSPLLSDLMQAISLKEKLVCRASDLVDTFNASPEKGWAEEAYSSRSTSQMDR